MCIKKRNKFTKTKNDFENPEKDIFCLFTLLKDIKRSKKIKQNASLFVQERGLMQIKTLTPYIDLGTIFLIKGNNIIEFYSYYDVDRSLYVEINYKLGIWIGNVNIINITNGDPENINFMLGSVYDYYNKDNYKMVIKYFIENGFIAYTKS
jgi:hypothetical protein